MIPFYFIVCSRRVCVCVLLLVTSTALRTLWPRVSAVNVSSDLKRGKNFDGRLSWGCHCASSSTLARPPLRHNRSPSGDGRTQGWCPNELNLSLIKSPQYVLHRSTAAAQRQCSRRRLRTLGNGWQRAQKQFGFNHCPALITTLAQRRSRLLPKYSTASVTGKVHPPGRRPVSASPSTDRVSPSCSRANRGPGDEKAASRLLGNVKECRSDSEFLHRGTWTGKDCFAAQRHEYIQLRVCSTLVPACSFLQNVLDAVLPVSNRLRNTPNLVKRWVKQWATGEEAAHSGNSASQGPTQASENDHPLGTQRWRFILQRRKWLGFRAADEEEAVEIDFLKDGTAVTEHGITGVWTTTRVGVSLFLFVPCLSECPSPPEEPAPAGSGAAPGQTHLQDSNSQAWETTPEIEYDVMHLTAHGHPARNTRLGWLAVVSCVDQVYWDAHNRIPCMYRGSVTKDRRAGFLPSFILRPVVATFYGYGIGENPENGSQGR